MPQMNQGPYNSRQSWKDSEKFLVAEQPGLGLSFIGIFLAFFMGLAIRAIVSSDKVQEHLKKATSSVHQNLQIDFQHAYVSLSRGILPDISVIIEDSKIELTTGCHFSPVLEVDQIRLPLSFWHLLQGKIFIHEILANQIDLSLRTDQWSCDLAPTNSAAEKNRSSSEVGVGNASLGPVAVSAASGAVANSPDMDEVASKTVSTLKKASEAIQKDFENVQRKNPIDTVRIANLRVHYLPIAFTSFGVDQFVIKLKSEDPKWVQMTGHLNLGGESLNGDHGSKADLKVDAVEGDQPSVKLSLAGVWREGHYKLAGNYDLKKDEFELSSNLHHLPLSQIVPLLKKYKLIEEDYNGKKIWFSGDLKMAGKSKSFSKVPISLLGLNLVGDIGEISAQHVDIESLEPFKVKPIDFSIKSLNISELLRFFNRTHPSPALGELGTFTGTGYFSNSDRLVLRGDYSGLQFVFANHGKRQIQNLSLISGELSLNKNQWNVSLDRIKPTEGLFDGKVQIVSDREFRKLAIQTKIDELSLSPAVQALMTDGGSLGAVSGDLKLNMDRAQIVDLRGQIKWDQILISGIHIAKPKMNLASVGNEVVVDLSAGQIDFLPKQKATVPVLEIFFAGLTLEKDQFSLKNPSMQLRTEKFQKLSWRQFQAQTNFGRLTSSGGWNENSELSGQINLAGKKNLSWEIVGDRANPKLQWKKRTDGK